MITELFFNSKGTSLQFEECCDEDTKKSTSILKSTKAIEEPFKVFVVGAPCSHPKVLHFKFTSS